MRKLTFLLVFTTLINTITTKSYAQALKHPYPSFLHETNSIFIMPEGWTSTDTATGVYGHVFCFTYSPFGIYNEKIDMYIFFGNQPIRAGLGFPSDSAANNFYLNPEYLYRQKLTPINEKPVTSFMLRSANVDTVAVFKVQMETPFLEKYHYAKQFVLHKQDIANISLTFVTKNKDDEQTIDHVFKEIWGMIRFR